MKRPSPGRIALLTLVAAAIAAALWLGVGDLVTLDTLKARRTGLAEMLEQRPVPIMALYFGLYVTFAALSIPGAAVMTLAGGAIFGFWRGLLLVSFASVLGAVLAFLGSR